MAESELKEYDSFLTNLMNVAIDQCDSFMKKHLSILTHFSPVNAIPRIPFTTNLYNTNSPDIFSGKDNCTGDDII